MRIVEKNDKQVGNQSGSVRAILSASDRWIQAGKHFQTNYQTLLLEFNRNVPVTHSQLVIIIFFFGSEKHTKYSYFFIIVNRFL